MRYISAFIIVAVMALPRVAMSEDYENPEGIGSWTLKSAGACDAYSKTVKALTLCGLSVDQCKNYFNQDVAGILFGCSSSVVVDLSGTHQYKKSDICKQPVYPDKAIVITVDCSVNIGGGCWSSAANSFVNGTSAACNQVDATTPQSYEYLCPPGFYGNPTEDDYNNRTTSNACTPCPNPDSEYTVTTSGFGAKVISECYSTGGADTSGSFTFESKCYYSE